MNSEICVFVAIYPYKISVLFHTFFFTFGKVTDYASFKYKDYIKVVQICRIIFYILPNHFLPCATKTTYLVSSFVYCYLYFCTHDQSR